MQDTFSRISRLPPYVFAKIGALKDQKRTQGDDVIDLSMGNPDGATPKHIVDKMVQAVQQSKTHRYSLSKGIPRLRAAISNWYKNRFDVDVDPESEAIVTIGSKEGIAHLTAAIMSSGDIAIVPSPSYPIHLYGAVMADADVRHVPLVEDTNQFLASIESVIKTSWPKPKVLILNFPCNPTAQCVDLHFWQRVVDMAHTYNIYVIQDIAYADIVFEENQVPSILQIKDAKEVAVEFFSLSKSYNMPGWRVGFCCGNKTLVSALARYKSYHDYGTFVPLQVAAIQALEGDQQCRDDICATYQSRRDVLCERLATIGWQVPKPPATMFAWGKIPDAYSNMSDVDFCTKVVTQANVALSPGSGFGPYGEGYVRFALIENEERIRQAVRNMRALLKQDGAL